MQKPVKEYAKKSNHTAKRTGKAGKLTKVAAQMGSSMTEKDIHVFLSDLLSTNQKIKAGGKEMDAGKFINEWRKLRMEGLR